LVRPYISRTRGSSLAMSNAFRAAGLTSISNAFASNLSIASIAPLVSASRRTLSKCAWSFRRSSSRSTVRPAVKSRFWTANFSAFGSPIGSNGSYCRPRYVEPK
jgi:hypothetical protein